MHRDSQSQMIIDERGTMKVCLEQGRRAIFGSSSRLLANAIAIAGSLALFFCSPSLASVQHRLEGSIEGPEALALADAVDNSAGPSAGDVYVAGFGTVAKCNPDGTSARVQFNGGETPQGSFFMLSGNTFSGALAVDGSAGVNSGDVYVTDLEHGAVDKFSEAGKFICEISTQPEPSTAECAGAKGSATLGGPIEPTGIAVDPVSGDVWVSDNAHAAIDEFNTSGELIEEVKGPQVVNPGPLALDSAGNLYVTNTAPILGSTIHNDV